MNRQEEVAWAVGLFEGEGCWHSGHHLTATLAMTDLDVLEHFAAVVGVGNIYKHSTLPHRKECWVWRTEASADLLTVGYLLGPFMHQRRQSALIELLDKIPNPRQVGVKQRGRTWATYDDPIMGLMENVKTIRVGGGYRGQ